MTYPQSSDAIPLLKKLKFSSNFSAAFAQVKFKYLKMLFVDRLLDGMPSLLLFSIVYAIHLYPRCLQGL